MTMPRKLSVLAATLLATALAGLGLTAFAAPQDEESELHKIMENVGKQNAAILKGTRNEVMFKKSQEDVVKAAKELAKLGKDAKPHNEPAKQQNQPVEKWDELMDSFIKESTTFAEEVEKKDVQQKVAKKAYQKVQTTCTDCHDIFRKDDF